MIAQVLRKIPLINKMMVGGEAKLKDRQATEGLLMDAMTQYRVEEAKRSFVESEDEQEQRDNLELLQAVTALQRTTWMNKGDRRD